MSLIFAINKKPIYYVNKYLVHWEETKKHLPLDTTTKYAMFLTDQHYVTQLITLYSSNYTNVLNNKIVSNLTKCYNMLYKLMHYRYFRLDSQELMEATRLAQYHTDRSNITK